jgi:alkaline phosphatase
LPEDLRAATRRSWRRLRLAALALGLLGLAARAGATPLNVILLIGDGMGPAHVEAARLYAGGPLVFDSAPHHARMTTDSLTSALNGQPTDSAASASAMSTGTKVRNTSVSVLSGPGFTIPLETMGEHFRAAGKAVGLVTTSYIEDATPAAFAAHALIRAQTARIADELLTAVAPEVLFGAVEPSGASMTPERAAAAGYTVVTTRAELAALESASAGPVSGQFGANSLPFEWDYAEGTDPGYDTVPFLSEMTAAALDLLAAADPDGFFLMAEQEGTDLAGHLTGDDPSRIGRNVFATLELSRTVELVLDWAADRDDTLILVTADHETGGLEILGDNGPGVLPDVRWTTSDHTRVPVDLWAWGPGAELVTGPLDNTDIRRIATLPEPGTGLLVGFGLLRVGRRRAGSELPAA